MKYVIYLPKEKCFYQGNDYEHLVFFRSAEDAAREITEKLKFKFKEIRLLDLKEAMEQLINDFEKSQTETTRKWNLCSQFVKEFVA